MFHDPGGRWHPGRGLLTWELDGISRNLKSQVVSKDKY